MTFFSVLRNNHGWCVLVSWSLVLRCFAFSLVLFLSHTFGRREIYHKRATQIHDLIWRPYPFLNRRLVDRCWSFLYPIFAMPDSAIFLSAGIDSLMIVRINLLGIQVFGPLTVLCLSVLLPLYRTGGYLESTESTGNVDSIMMYTLSNVASKDNRLWAGALRALWTCNVTDARCSSGHRHQDTGNLRWLRSLDHLSLTFPRRHHHSSDCHEPVHHRLGSVLRVSPLLFVRGVSLVASAAG